MELADDSGNNTVQHHREGRGTVFPTMWWIFAGGCVFNTASSENWVDVLEVVTSPGQTTCELVTVAGASSIAPAQEMIDGFS